MIARMLGMALAALALAAPAQGAVPLARVEHADVAVVLAGDTVVFTRADAEEVDVLAAPVGGPPGATALLRVPLRRGESGSISLDASPQRVAAIVHAGETAQLYEGPPAGPLAPVSAPAPVSENAFAPFKVFVDGDHVLVAENRDGFEDPRYRIDGGDPFTVPGYVVGFAGDLLAYSTEARRLVLRNWRTGAERVLAIRGQIVSFDLRADGAAAADLGDGTVLATSPAGAVTRVTTNGEQPHWAGGQIVYNGIFGLRIAEPGATPRPFGPRTASVFVLDANERHVAWAAHGCLLAAPVDEPTAAAPGPGPCLRSEIWIDQPEHAAIGRDRRVPLYLYCMAAADACRGTAHVLLSDHGRRRSSTVRFSIPAGRTRRLMPRLTRAGYRAARRVKDGGVEIEVGGVLTDPDGRTQRFFGQYSVAVR
jgi:hypothetical protein